MVRDERVSHQNTVTFENKSLRRMVTAARGTIVTGASLVTVADVGNMNTVREKLGNELPSRRERFLDEVAAAQELAADRGHSLTLTGHSAGGGYAAYASHKTGVPAYVRVQRATPAPGRGGSRRRRAHHVRQRAARPRVHVAGAGGGVAGDGGGTGAG